jgi:hypothetical protein
MTKREFDQRVRGKTHHHGLFTMKDGSVRDGYMQPNDGTNLFLTTLDGKSGGKVVIEDILKIEFPED